MGVCNCSMFCCTLLCVHSSNAIILMSKRELIALLNLSSLCLVMVERLFLAVPRGCLQFVIVVFPDHTHLLFLIWSHLSFGGRYISARKTFLKTREEKKSHRGLDQGNRMNVLVHRPPVLSKNDATLPAL